MRCRVEVHPPAGSVWQCVIECACHGQLGVENVLYLGCVLGCVAASRRLHDAAKPQVSHDGSCMARWASACAVWGKLHVVHWDKLLLHGISIGIGTGRSPGRWGGAATTHFCSTGVLPVTFHRQHARVKHQLPGFYRWYAYSYPFCVYINVQESCDALPHDWHAYRLQVTADQ